MQDNIAQSSATFRILLATDVFPPKCGGSGWSTYYLARALRERGHYVVVARPRIGLKRNRITDYDGFVVHEYAHRELPIKVPLLTNYQRNERLYAGFSRFLRDLARRERVQLIHGQNGLSIPPAVMAASKLGSASVSTIRDWWAICYFGTLRHGDIACAGCTARDLAKALLHIAGVKGIAAWPLIPYMRRNLQLKQRWLGRSSRVIAVSQAAARRIQPYVAAAKLSVVPNMIDFAALNVTLAEHSAPLIAPPYWAFSGKLEPNKGAELLLPALAAAKSVWPTLVLGDGKLRESLAAGAEAAGLGLHLSAWLPNDEALRQMAMAGGLLFPSGWPEPLSRVLLEAAAIGLPIVAMNTGGTSDIIRDGETGLLATDLPTFAAAIARLEADPNLRTHLGQAARTYALATFSKDVVVPQVEAIYAEAIRLV